MSVSEATVTVNRPVAMAVACGAQVTTPLSLAVSTDSQEESPGSAGAGGTSGSGGGGNNTQVPGSEALLAAAESHLAAAARSNDQSGQSPALSSSTSSSSAAAAAATTTVVVLPTLPGTSSQEMGPTVAAPSVSGTTSNITGNVQQSLPTNRHEMFQAFQSWALQNYGDSGKTKTVTCKKYERIVRILSGQEQATTENSKFRFWVKAKGFRLGPPPPDESGAEDQVLYVPTRVTGAVNGDDDKSYKRVAVVEDFFQIIYNVHVEMDGRGGKHAGQKRTYRAIAETYAFLPREAVTRFLMSCADCQKRMHLSLETNNNNHHHHTATAASTPVQEANVGLALPAVVGGGSGVQESGTAIIDFSLPITTTYLNHLRSQRPSPDASPGPPHHFTDAAVYHRHHHHHLHHMMPEREASQSDSTSSAESEMSGEPSPSPPANSSGSPRPTDVKPEATNSASRTSTPNSLRNNMPVKIKSEVDVSERNGTSGDEKPVKMSAVTKVEERGRLDRKRRASDESVDSSTRASESGLGENDNKDDDEDDDAEDEEKLASSDIDPERLKAFNMFVRLFVDENLDRMVPISKQPKDKIQAILDACDRQFPEFHERSRKRIRTYLKSCRRMRRSKEQNGWESLRPTPPHLTSAAAEGLLAQACENESNNAKRMRMGLEPLPASVTNHTPLPPSQNSQPSPGQPSPGHQQQQHQSAAAAAAAAAAAVSNSSSRSATSTPTGQSTVVAPPASGANAPSLDRQTPGGSSSSGNGTGPLGGADYIRHSPVSASFRPSHELPSPFFSTSNGIFRPGLPASYGSPPAHHHPSVLQQATHGAAPLQNGESCPTDLSMKSKSQTTGGSGATGGSSKNQLNPTEVATIKQLIAGYRESAAFLYRSADELEQLLLQQN